MSDPYLFGFYVGMATAMVVELAAALGFAAIIRARKAKRKPASACSTCETETDPSTGISRDSLFKLYVCPECGDAVPRRFALSSAVPVADVVAPIDRVYDGLPPDSGLEPPVTAT